MKSIVIVSILLASLLFGDTDFITPFEYASQLYKNPRGIGCEHCHGDNGEGRLVASYIHKGKHREFRGPPINKISLKIFYEALNVSKKGMPRYYLTFKEIQALHFFLQEKNKVDNDGE